MIDAKYCIWFQLYDKEGYLEEQCTDEKFK